MQRPIITVDDLTTPDVDALYAELVRRGARVRAKPENKPWGMREMQVADPDGNVLRIGSPIRRAQSLPIHEPGR